MFICLPLLCFQRFILESNIGNFLFLVKQLLFEFLTLCVNKSEVLLEIKNYFWVMVNLELEFFSFLSVFPDEMFLLIDTHLARLMWLFQWSEVLRQRFYVRWGMGLDYMKKTSMHWWEARFGLRRWDCNLLTLVSSSKNSINFAFIPFPLPSEFLLPLASHPLQGCHRYSQIVHRPSHSGYSHPEGRIKSSVC